MNEPHDPNRTVDVPSAPADSLDAGLVEADRRKVGMHQSLSLFDRSGPTPVAETRPSPAPDDCQEDSGG